MIYVLGIIFIVLLISGLPIAVAMGIATIVPLLQMDIPLAIIIQRMFAGMDSQAMLAIPTFLLAGDLMVAGGISDGLIRFAGNTIGRFRGGMANTMVLSCIIFAGISGSAVADTAAVGSVMLPAMKKNKYPSGYSATLLAFGGALGPIIPPSVIMVIYGGMTEVSVGKLFLAGAIPGLVMGFGFLIINYFWVPRMGIVPETKSTFSELIRSFVKSVWALIAPFIIIFGILTGVFTPTEAGVIAAVYSFIVGYFIFRGFAIRQLPEILLKTCFTTSIIMTIIAFAHAFAWIIARLQVSEALLKLLFSITTTPEYIMLLIIAFLGLIGCFIEVNSSRNYFCSSPF